MTAIVEGRCRGINPGAIREHGRAANYVVAVRHYNDIARLQITAAQRRGGIVRTATIGNRTLGRTHIVSHITNHRNGWCSSIDDGFEHCSWCTFAAGRSSDGSRQVMTAFDQYRRGVSPLTGSVGHHGTQQGSAVINADNTARSGLPVQGWGGVVGGLATGQVTGDGTCVVRHRSDGNHHGRGVDSESNSRALRADVTGTVYSLGRERMCPIG